MSTVDAAAKWFDRASDFANAILVKETRQALKSRQFVVVFMLVLAASWAASVLFLVMYESAIEYGSAGRSLFMIFFMVLSAAVLLVVPFFAYRSLLVERDQNTYELLSITALSPRQIVWGKLLSALVLVFLFYSAITPFIAFASLLQGFDIVSAAYLLVATLLASLFFSTTAIMLASFARQRASQAGTALVVFGALAYGFGGFIQIAAIPLALDDPEFWWWNAFVVVGALSYLVLFQQIAIAQLTFESDNRSSRIRMTCSGQFWLLWLAFMSYHLFQKRPWPASEIAIWTNVSIVHWAMVGLVASTEPDHLSIRIRRQLPRWRIARLLVSPLMPGGSRGYLYFVLHVAALWLLSVALTFDADRAAGGPAAGHSMKELFFGLTTLSSETSWHPAVRTTTALCCYVIIYIGIGAILSRWLRSVVSDARSSHLRVLTFFVFGAGLIGPLIPKMINPRLWRNYSVLEVSNVFVTYGAIERNIRDFERAMPVLLLATLIVLLLNARAMVRGVREIVAESASRLPRAAEPSPAAPVAPSGAPSIAPREAAH